MYAIKEIYTATSIEDTVLRLVEQPNAVIIAGGSDVLIKIREGKMANCSLVSLEKVNELRGITKMDDGTIKIGPLTTFSQLTYNEVISEYLPMLGAAVDKVGGPQIRNVGTIGGNICNGVTSADSASTLFSYNAVLEITGAKGVRKVPISSFYKGPGRVDVRDGELLSGIYIAKEDYENFYGKYIKYGMRHAMDIATLGCAINCRLDDTKKKVEEIRIALGVAGPVPMRCLEAEKELKGKVISEEIFELAGSLVTKEAKPRDSWRASKDFRLQLIKELTKRAFKESVLVAGGEI